MKTVSEHQQLIDAICLLLTEQQRTTDAITVLAEALAGRSAAPTAEPSPTPVDDTPDPKWAEPDCTKDQLQSYCIAEVRKDSGFKARLTATLAKYGAKTISKLADADAAKVYAELEGVE